MNGTTGEQRRPGVYGVDGDGREQQVHPYQGGPYTLSDVVHLFDLGRVEESAGGTVLVLTAKEVRTLKTMADAYSFDYEEEFIEMCLWRWPSSPTSSSAAKGAARCASRPISEAPYIQCPRGTPPGGPPGVAGAHPAYAIPGEPPPGGPPAVAGASPAYAIPGEPLGHWNSNSG